MDTITQLKPQVHDLPLRRVFVNDLILDAEIGVWSHEKGKTQKVRINVDLLVHEASNYHQDKLENVVCYNEIVTKIQTLLKQGHMSLVETLAENIAALCLEDNRVYKTVIKVEKLEAIENAESVGVEITRYQNN